MFEASESVSSMGGAHVDANKCTCSPRRVSELAAS
jgi:hypothetical protein